MHVMVSASMRRTMRQDSVQSTNEITNKITNKITNEITKESTNEITKESTGETTEANSALPAMNMDVPREGRRHKEALRCAERAALPVPHPTRPTPTHSPTHLEGAGEDGELTPL